MSTSAAILRFAEEPLDELPEPWLPGRRFIRSGFTLNLSPTPTQSSVSRVRATAENLDATIAEVRGILREHGFVACGWRVGPSCRPVELGQLLADRGFVPATRSPFEPHYAVMVLTRPPPPRALDPGVEARQVRDLDEYVRALRAGFTAGETPEEAIEKWIEAAPAGWNHEGSFAKMTHIGFADGNVAGLGLVCHGPQAVMLDGGAVLPAFRGRGVYRALVTSRWHAAVAAGRPALTVHAGSMSRPILERCGFEELSRLDVLMDPALGG